MCLISDKLDLMMSRFKFPLFFLFLLFGSLGSFALQDFMFGHLEDVTALIRGSMPVQFSKKVIFPATCNLSLNGWGKGPFDNAADEYLKMTNLKMTLHSGSSSEGVAPTNHHDSKILFDVNRSGTLEIVIRNYEQPSKDIETVDVVFFCKGTGQFLIFIGSCFFTLISMAGFFITLIQSFLRKEDEQEA